MVDVSKLLQAIMPCELEVLASIESAIRDGLAAAKLRWPGVELDDSQFMEFVARNTPQDHPREFLERLPVADVFLVAACVSGNKRAIDILDREFVVPAVVRASRSHAVNKDELAQVVREKLLVGTTNRGPATSRYSGKAPLGAWLRVVVVRSAVDLIRQASPPRSEVSDEALVDFVADDFESSRIRRELAQQFREAFAQSLRQLAPKDRTVLRMHGIHGVSIDEIGRVYGVHRATAARWLIHIRDQLLEETKRHLMDQLKLSPQELESTIRLLVDRASISLDALLTEAQAASLAAG